MIMEKIIYRLHQYVKIEMTLIVLTILINILLLNKMPDQMALQMSLQGDLVSFVNKHLFIGVVPIISISLAIYGNIINKDSKLRMYIYSIIMFMVNIFLLYINLK